VVVQEQAEKRLTAQQNADAARAKAEGERLELEAKAAIQREERRDVQSAKTHDMFAKLLQSSMAGSVTERLKKLKALYDEGVISKAVYDTKEAQLLAEL
jgi:microsomal dipeptidase-like Zn-dependent dipeptidase